MSPQYRGDLAAADLKPDFKTIADFRRDNCDAFSPVFRQFVLLCRRSRPVRPRVAGGGWHADQGGQQQGSQFHPRVVGQVHQDSRRTLDDYLQRLDKGDAAERSTGGSRVKNLAEKIAALRSGASATRTCWRSWTAPARARSRSPTRQPRHGGAHACCRGYNVQIAVDAKHKLIVEQQ